MSDKDKQARERAEAEVNERIDATLTNPKLVSALANLRAATPAGEQLFGFKVEPADARPEVPSPELVEPVEGAAIVADREAAAAYVQPVSPATAVAPRMPTGRVRFSPRAADADPRRRSTQRSIAKGGQGPRPPTLEGEADDTTPAVLERPAAPTPVRLPIEPTPPGSGEPSRKRGILLATFGFTLVVALLVALVLRAPKLPDPSGATTAAVASSLVPPAAIASDTSSSAPPTALPSLPTPTAITSAAPSASAHAAPSSPSASVLVPSTPSASQRPGLAPRVTAAPPAQRAPTSADPVPPPPPTVAPSAPPVEPQPTSKPLIYD